MISGGESTKNLCYFQTYATSFIRKGGNAGSPFRFIALSPFQDRLSATSLFANGYLLYSSLMASAFKRSREKLVHNGIGLHVGHEAAGHDKHIGIVVLACQLGNVGPPAKSRPDALVLVQGHGDAVSASADGDARIAFSGFYGTGSPYIPSLWLPAIASRIVLAHIRHGRSKFLWFPFSYIFKMIIYLSGVKELRS